MEQLTKNFNLNEFRCKDGTQVPENLLSNIQNLAQQLQVIRDHLGEPVYINSGYRTPSYNKKIGGVNESQHVNAKAADIKVKGKSPKQLAVEIEKLITEGKVKIGGIGIYPSFVHVDTRLKKARW